jgi:DNA transformation protein
MRALSSLKGLGPRSAEMLPLVGIRTADELLATDPYEVYARLRAAVPGTSLNALYAIIGAIEDRNWLDIKRERKGEILMRLEDMGLAPR